MRGRMQAADCGFGWPGDRASARCAPGNGGTVLMRSAGGPTASGRNLMTTGDAQ